MLSYFIDGFKPEMAQSLTEPLKSKVLEYQHGHQAIYKAFQDGDLPCFEQWLAKGFPVSVQRFFTSEETQEMNDAQEYCSHLLEDVHGRYKQVFCTPEVKSKTSLLEFLGQHIPRLSDCPLFINFYIAHTSNTEYALSIIRAIYDNEHAPQDKELLAQSALYNEDNDFFQRFLALHSQQQEIYEQPMRSGLYFLQMKWSNALNFSSWKLYYEKYFPLAVDKLWDRSDLRSVKEYEAVDAWLWSFSNVFSYYMKIFKQEERSCATLKSIIDYLSEQYASRFGQKNPFLIDLVLLHHEIKCNYIYLWASILGYVPKDKQKMLASLDKRYLNLKNHTLEQIHKSIPGAIENSPAVDCYQTLQQLHIDPKHYQRLANYIKMRGLLPSNSSSEDCLAKVKKV